MVHRTVLGEVRVSAVCWGIVVSASALILCKRADAVLEDSDIACTSAFGKISYISNRRADQRK
jgi:hypothetical protein